MVIKIHRTNYIHRVKGVTQSATFVGKFWILGKGTNEIVFYQNIENSYSILRELEYIMENCHPKLRIEKIDI